MKNKETQTTTTPVTTAKGNPKRNKPRAGARKSNASKQGAKPRQQRQPKVEKTVEVPDVKQIQTAELESSSSSSSSESPSSSASSSSTAEPQSPKELQSFNPFTVGDLGTFNVVQTDSVPDQLSIQTLYYFSVHKIYTYRFDIGDSKSFQLEDVLIRGPFSDLGNKLYAKLGLIGLRPKIDSIGKILNGSLYIYSTIVALQKKLNCFLKTDPTGSTNVGRVFSADSYYVENSATRLYQDIDTAYPEIERNYSISNNSWRKDWLDLLKDLYLTDDAITNVMNLYSQYIRLRDKSTVSIFLDISTDLLSTARDEKSLLSDLKGIRDLIVAEYSGNPGLIELLRIFQCKNLHETQFDNLYNRDPSSTTIKWVYDKQDLFACSFYNSFMYSFRPSLRDGTWTYDDALNIYSLEYMDKLKYDPNEITRHFITELKLSDFVVIDLFRFLGCKTRTSHGYSKVNGVSIHYRLQLSIPGYISENEKFPDLSKVQSLEVVNWFERQMLFSQMHLPNIQYSGVYTFSFSDIPPNFSFDLTDKDQFNVFCDTKSVLIKQNADYRSLIEMEFFWNNHRKVFEEIRQSYSSIKDNI